MNAPVRRAVWLLLLPVALMLLDLAFHVARGRFLLTFLAVTAFSVALAPTLLKRGSGRPAAGERLVDAARRIPRAVVAISAVAIVGNSASVLSRTDVYPFYSVSMFAWVTPAQDLPPVIEVEKYATLGGRIPTILELRREGSLVLPGVLGPRYGHLFTFSATFHNPSERGTFELLQSLVSRAAGGDLWVVVQTHDFRTGETTTSPDLCAYRRAMRVNLSRLYVPPYQRALCETA